MDELFKIQIQREWFSTEEAAEYLRVSSSVLHNLCSQGKVPYCKLGRRNRFRREDLDELLLRNRRGVLND
jgi:excisionase family DNA binding protein